MTNLKVKTQKLGVRIIKLCEFLFDSKSEINKIIGRQILRSGTSVGANYRAVSRAKSTADFKTN